MPEAKGVVAHARQPGNFEERASINRAGLLDLDSEGGLRGASPSTTRWRRALERGERVHQTCLTQSFET
eukprot:5086641-Amphidinium_carterae.1